MCIPKAKVKGESYKQPVRLEEGSLLFIALLHGQLSKLKCLARVDRDYPRIPVISLVGEAVISHHHAVISMSWLTIKNNFQNISYIITYGFASIITKI